VIALLARHCLDLGIAFPGLRGVRTFGETLHDDLRQLVREAWGVTLTDAYSSEEVGMLAVQCPGTEHYHVMSESALVEVLRPDGTPCGPGETGRVVVTPLHNYAMPLLRYDLGDSAEIGGPCPCGRHLPVLTRVLGKRHQAMLMPDGTRRFVLSGARAASGVAAVRRVQVAQLALDLVELRLEVFRPLTADGMKRQIGQHLRVTVVYRDSLAGGANGKFEVFRCEIA
jgi:phenylacetate-CoA ligase